MTKLDIMSAKQSLSGLLFRALKYALSLFADDGQRKSCGGNDLPTIVRQGCRNALARLWDYRSNTTIDDVVRIAYFNRLAKYEVTQ
jgi:hypothetical protein